MPIEMSGLLCVRRRALRRRANIAGPEGSKGPIAGGRSSGSCGPAEAFASVYRRGRPAGAVSRAGVADSASAGTRNPRADCYQRLPNDGPDLGEFAALARSGVHRWIATGARCAASAGDLRSHSKKYRGAEGHDPLHGHGPNDEATGILGRIPGILDAASGDQESMVQPVHASSWRSTAGDAECRGAGAGHCGYEPIAEAISEAGHARGGDSAVRVATAQPARLCFRTDDPDVVGRPGDQDHSMPVWGES